MTWKSSEREKCGDGKSDGSGAGLRCRHKGDPRRGAGGCPGSCPEGPGRLRAFPARGKCRENKPKTQTRIGRASSCLGTLEGAETRSRTRGRQERRSHSGSEMASKGKGREPFPCLRFREHSSRGMCLTGMCRTGGHRLESPWAQAIQVPRGTPDPSQGVGMALPRLSCPSGNAKSQLPAWCCPFPAGKGKAGLSFPGPPHLVLSQLRAGTSLNLPSQSQPFPPFSSVEPKQPHLPLFR